MRPDLSAAMAQLTSRIRWIVGSAAGRSIEGDWSLPGGQLLCTGVRTRARIADATGLALDADSAANACALASAWFDNSDVESARVVVTVSEEIQAGIFANGHFVRGRNGMAGDYGHVPLDPNGPTCECGGRGCWTVFASNRAALRYHARRGKHARTFLDLLNLPDQGDAPAAKTLETMAYWLSVGLRAIVGGIAPDSILVVGELTRA